MCGGEGYAKEHPDNQTLKFVYCEFIESAAGNSCYADSMGLWPSPEWRRAPAVFAFFVLADDEQWVY